ncbi:cytochrome b5-like heme/steroid-binding domain protein (macronuclear) [Tetrahymena thermophila SB210]|uniref:Cytochrome b5-like heme/steroid-binding domain protein n=1 Tax=Tetrahymena thermophila (strain SB210) TaxID=312017 RepID=Q240P3_TETTS|nr:cytochrome b5-like heme/steroid-binding domain protein [Tetrahymena thermophila SB210]EAS02371.1 cytochrome b5-like heme/steroid-binding domain protein [Tetrahymena thermophila SB210]|eukprot:XP_001022616.1 cytochrome b5-like heme/steroid-binding domain protein [Tetrahymena thermophila SB210]
MADKKEITYQEVAKHNKADDCWVIIDNGVYNLTEQMKSHPPGPFMIKLFAGKEATWLFKRVLLHSEKVFKNKEKYRVGTLKRVEGEKIPNNAELFITFAVIMLALLVFFLLK